MYAVGFSGTQEGMTRPQMDKVAVSLLNLLRPVLNIGDTMAFHQGQCIGADYQATSMVQILGTVWTVSHPPINQSKVHNLECDEVWPAKPYLERNHDIVDATRLLILAPRTMEEELRSGTWATYRYAKQVHKPVLICFPDGSTRAE